MAIDRENAFGGEVHCFWGVGKPILENGTVWFGAAKVGGDTTKSFMDKSEGIFYACDNITTETDPAKLNWQLLPDGDKGLRAPVGTVADEHNPAMLSDGTLYCTYRSVGGALCHAYSHDGGHTWDGPQFATYTPGGRIIKHPRAANFVRKFSNGKFILWYHNHGGTYFMDRNPAWMSGGIERNGKIHWSQPEIVLYDTDPGTRISYPDFIEQDGRYWITETQKTVARTHEVDPAVLEGMWAQGETKSISTDGLVLDLHGADCAAGTPLTFPRLPNPAEEGGFSLDFWITPSGNESEEITFDTRNVMGRGITVSLLPWGAVRLAVADRVNEDVWESDRGLLTPGKPHHVAITVDGAARVVSFVIDGILCDGGADRPKGWYRMLLDLGNLDGDGLAGDTANPVTFNPAMTSTLHSLRVYDRYLRTSEAVSHFHAGLPT